MRARAPARCAVDLMQISYVDGGGRPVLVVLSELAVRLVPAPLEELLLRSIALGDGVERYGRAGIRIATQCAQPPHDNTGPVSYTHLTLPTTPYV